MPESSKMEDLIHHKMQQFVLEPDPADWDAIYDRLHKKKRRIIFWWILPLAGALLIGSAIYLGSGRDDSATTIPAIAAGQNKARNPSTNENTSTSKNIAAPETTINTTHSDNPISDNANPVDDGGNSIDANKQVAMNRPAPGTGKPITAKEATAAKRGSPAHNGSTPNIGEAEKPDRKNNSAVAQNEEPSPESGLTALPMTDEESDPAFANRTPEQVNLDIIRTMPPVDSRIAVPQTTQTELLATEQKSIPNLTTHKDKGWYLGAYAGAGSNIPGSPISFTKAMDFNAGPSGGNSYNLSSSYMKNGTHVDAGLVLQKKTTTFELSFGIGLQRNTWTQGYTIYQDSILPSGALFSRTDVASKESRYQHAAIDLPILVGFRIFQKGASGIWLNAGINNSFTLFVKELDSKVSGTPSYSGGNFTDPITSPVNKYHPMLRLGLAYDHSGAKAHWQLLPMMQYSLNNVIQRGDPDIRLLQLGLQFRYYFKAIRQLGNAAMR